MIKAVAVGDLMPENVKAGWQLLLGVFGDKDGDIVITRRGIFQSEEEKKPWAYLKEKRGKGKGKGNKNRSK